MRAALHWTQSSTLLCILQGLGFWDRLHCSSGLQITPHCLPWKWRSGAENRIPGTMRTAGLQSILPVHLSFCTSALAASPPLLRQLRLVFSQRGAPKSKYFHGTTCFSVLFILLLGLIHIRKLLSLKRKKGNRKTETVKIRSTLCTTRTCHP